jgi:hypothetical protein
MEIELSGARKFQIPVSTATSHKARHTYPPPQLHHGEKGGCWYTSTSPRVSLGRATCLYTIEY